MPDEQSRRVAEQWRLARFERILRRLRQTREWISFADVADFCACESGLIEPDQARRGRAYDHLADALIKGEFDDEGGRTRVLLLYPGSRKMRLTWRWLADAIELDLDGARGRELLAHSWAPREAMARFLERRRLPVLPAAFGPPESDGKPAKRRSSRASRIVARSRASREPTKNERKRFAVDKTIREIGVDAFANLMVKKRQKAIKEIGRAHV